MGLPRLRYGGSIIAVLIATNQNSTILGLVSYAWGGFGSAFGPLVLCSLFWKRTNKQGAYAGILVGGIVDLVWAQLSGGIFDLYEIVPGFVCGLIAIFVVSLLTATPSKEITTSLTRTVPARNKNESACAAAPACCSQRRRSCSTGDCCLPNGSAPRPSPRRTPPYFLDVGEGDCTLLVSGGSTVLVDAGTPEGAPALVRELKSLGVRRLDAVIATHPHADHIGGMEAVLRAFPVRSFTWVRKRRATRWMRRSAGADSRPSSRMTVRRSR